MATFEHSIEIHADRTKLFILTQDYKRRLQWDPFLKEACLKDGANGAGVGVRAWCVSKTGMGMETEYVSYEPPELTAIKMTKGPAILASFAGSWRFEEVAPNLTRVIFRYHLAARPRWLGFILEPILKLVFSSDTMKRLRALKHVVETTDILNY